METYVLNRNFEVIDLIDCFQSLEWVKRFNQLGDFVMVVAANTKHIQSLQKRFYLVREDDEMICMIESINIKTSAESGNILTVKGSSIEKLLGRRIVWNQTNSKASETVEDFIRRLVDENCINPTNPKRKIPRLKLGTRKGFTEKIEKQITGDNLLTAIIEICQAYNYGFKIYMDNEGYLVFDLYKGTNRSYSQNINSFVVFSNDFDNLGETEYNYDESNLTNVALIGGEGEGKDRKYQTIGDSEGFDRYELFVDANDISSNEGEISLEEYYKLLIQRGIEKLVESSFIETFDGEVETERMYKYKKDYDLGDVVQIENEYDMKASSRITEIIESQNENGYRIVPTFSAWEVQE